MTERQTLKQRCAKHELEIAQLKAQNAMLRQIIRLDRMTIFDKDKTFEEKGKTLAQIVVNQISEMWELKESE